MASSTQTNVLATGAENEIRMILLGRTGTGKSSVGNTILGETRFKSQRSPIGVTTNCASGARNFENKRLFVVDTPGFLDPRITEKSLQEEIGKSYQMTAFPGPHVFLLVFEPGRWLAQEDNAVNYLSKIFGPKAINHTIIIFTHGDDLEEEQTTLESYLSKIQQNTGLNRLMEECGRRYLLFDNKASKEKKDQAVKHLLQMIETMVSRNPDKVYITDVFEALAKEIANEKAKGTFDPVKPDGSYALLPQTKEIVIDGYLRRTVGRRA